MTSHGCRMTSNVNLSAAASETSSSLRALVIQEGKRAPLVHLPQLEKVNFPFCFWFTEDFTVKSSQV